MSFGLDQCSGQDGDAATDSQSSSSIGGSRDAPIDSLLQMIEHV
jgi:hypothetical protein